MVYALSKEGARLILSARRTSELERVKKGCLNPDAIDIVPIDLSSQESVNKAIAECLSRHTRIDMLFNNGGISQRAEALDTDIEIVRRLMEIDFFSNVTISRAVALHMKEHCGGHIIITSSLMGKWGFYLRSAYAAAKHALHGYYDSMRMEVEPFKIQITLLLTWSIIKQHFNSLIQIFQSSSFLMILSGVGSRKSSLMRDLCFLNLETSMLTCV